MSIPKHKVLSVSKGFGINAQLSHKNQKQTQNVVVNINKSGEAIAEVKYGETPKAVSENPYAHLELPTNVEEFQRILTAKDNNIQALNLIIHIIKSNPLMINNFVISYASDLEVLMKLLTGGDEVQIVPNDFEAGCCSSGSCVMIDKIFVAKNGETQNLKYNYPEVIRTLDEYRITYRMCL